MINLLFEKLRWLRKIVSRTKKQSTSWIVFLAIFIGSIVIAGLWQFTPLKHYANVEFLRHITSGIRGFWWSPLIIVAIYLIANSILFPNMVLNTATILVFGGLRGWSYAIVGSLTVSTVYFFLGQKFAFKKMKHFHSERFDKITQLLRDGGVGTVVAVRLLPLGPYPLICSAAGAINIRFWQFIMGTFIAHLPATLTLAILGTQLQNVFTKPNPISIAVLIIAVGLGVFLIWFSKEYARKRLQKKS